MSLDTFSIFYYGFEITDSSRYISFDEGGGELTATLTMGSYTPTDIATEAQTALNAAGALTYTVTFNRSTRTFTIAATGTFSLLVSSGTSGASAFSMFGFTGTDRTSAATYTGGVAGSEYRPQFILQDHISTDNFQKLVSPKVNKAANGSVEVVRFGTEKFLQVNLKYITNKESDGRVIKYNASGVSDAQYFMRWITLKKEVEFMPSISDRSTYQSFILESTPDDKDGTGYKLKELYDKGLPNFFETGPLVFRLIE
jgi:hypothetical protein